MKAVQIYLAATPCFPVLGYRDDAGVLRIGQHGGDSSRALTANEVLKVEEALPIEEAPAEPHESPSQQTETVLAALDAYRNLLLSPTSADRAAHGDVWADKEAAACAAIRMELKDRTLLVPQQGLSGVEGYSLWGIAGRNWGDDDDTTGEIWARSEENAVAAFKVQVLNVPEGIEIPEDGRGSVIITGRSLIGCVKNGQFLLSRDVLPSIVSPIEESVEKASATADLIRDIDHDSEALLELLDHSGSMQSVPVQRAAASLRRSIALAAGDHERAQYAQETMDELGAESHLDAPRG